MLSWKLNCGDVIINLSFISFAMSRFYGFVKWQQVTIIVHNAELWSFDIGANLESVAFNLWKL